MAWTPDRRIVSILNALDQAEQHLSLLQRESKLGSNYTKNALTFVQKAQEIVSIELSREHSLPTFRRAASKVAHMWIKKADKALKDFEDELQDNFRNHVRKITRTTFHVQGRTQNYEVSYNPYAGKDPYSLSIIHDEALEPVDRYDDPTILVEILSRMLRL